MNKFDKPYRVLPTYDVKKSIELFNLASKLDTHQLLQFTLINQIPLDVVNDNDECLIHEVISIDPRISSEHGKLNVIKFLVQNGVNPDKPNKYNKTPLHMACNMQLGLIAEYLLSVGVNPNYTDNFGFTPMHYLLTGNIKELPPNNEIIDFIPTINPKKQNIEVTNMVLDIKKLLWDLLKSMDISNNIPIFDTINKTLNNILIEDKEILNSMTNLLNTISELSKKTEPDTILPTVKNKIDMAKDVIKDKITKLLKISPLNNFSIEMIDEPLSWTTSSLPGTTLIKNGNIKKLIKNDIEKQIQDMEKLNNYKAITYDDNYMMNGFSDIYTNHIIPLFKNKRDPNTGIDYIRNNPNGDKFFVGDMMDFLEGYDKINDIIRHPNAIDNASSIIDFKNLKYMGGPRRINIIKEGNMLQELKNILELDENRRILCLLGLPYTDINALKPNYDYYKTLSTIYIGNDINNNCIISPQALDEKSFTDSWYNLDDTNKILDTTDLDNIKLILEYKYYITLAYTAIKYPEHFKELIDNNTISPDNRFNDNKFANKWYDIYINMKPNLGEWIFGMWCDLTSKLSDSNLECYIHTRTLMLIGCISSDSYNMTQNLICYYKPQIIDNIFGTNDNANIAKWIVTLLNDKIDIDFIKEVQKDTYNDNMDITPKLKDIGKIIYDYIVNKKITTTQMIYNTYANKLKTPLDNICSLILNYYLYDMNHKPLKQTVLDTIYLLRLGVDSNAYKKISTYNIDLTKNPFNEVVVQPSYYSLYNFWLDNEVTNHFIIAHYLGLFYEGLITYTNFNLDDSLPIKIGKDDFDFYTVADENSHDPIQFHTLDQDDELILDQLALPLNFLNIQQYYYMNHDMKYHFYSFVDKDDNGMFFRFPTNQSYVVSLIKKIKEYQNQIILLLEKNKFIIDRFKKGDTKTIKTLYIEIYPKLVSYCKIINNYIKTLKEQPKSDLIEKFKDITNFNYMEYANILNKINSDYYLYYYLFSPEKLIKMSKFNYFQLPIDIPSSYLYFSKDDNKLVNILTDDNNYAKGSRITSVKDYDKGFVTNYSIGNYDNIINEYYNGNLPIEITVLTEDFRSLKTSKLPPALYYSLNDFYRYSLIEIIKKVILYIDSNKTVDNTPAKNIYVSTKNLVDKIIIASSNIDLSIYNNICKIIEELVTEQINIYIDNAVEKYYNNFYTDNADIKPLSSILFKLKDMNVNLEYTKLKLTKIRKPYLQNLYSPIINTKADMNLFILYPNDMSNMNKLRLKHGLNVNSNIIETLLNNNSSPYMYNNENLSPIYPIIKNYNYMLVEKLSNMGIDFRYFDKEMPIEFIKKENHNNINKVIGTYKDIDPLQDLLSNIDLNLYYDTKSKIISNEIFGNNVLLYLPESFHICTYITLQFLSEHLLNTNTDFSIIDMSKLCKILDISLNNINSNYLGENLESLKVPDELNTLIGMEIIKNKKKELDDINSKLSILNKTIATLRKEKQDDMANKTKGSSNYTLLLDRKSVILEEIKRITKITNNSNNYLKNTSSIEDNIIDRYEELNNKYDIGLIIWAWSELLKKPLNNIKNQNLIPYYMLIRQREYFTTLKNHDEMQYIKKGMKHLSQLGESYFETNKFTDMNPFLSFIQDLLEYITKMVIGNGIELMMRRILLTYFTTTDINSNIEMATYRIKQILNLVESGKTKSLKDILYDVVCPLLVKNSAEIYANRAEEQGSFNTPVREILSNYFQLLSNAPNLPPELLNVFTKDVVTYFDTFVSRTIYLWYVNIENILKYFINNYRCIETYNQLTNKLFG